MTQAEPALSDSKAFMWKLLALLVTAEFTAAFETTMMFSSVGVFVKEFGSPVGVGWLITAYLMVAAAAAAICGRLGDLFGYRRMLLIMLTAATVGSVISATASSLPQVIAGRALQGFAGAILPLCYGVLRENLVAHRLAYANSIMGLSLTLAAASGLAAGGALSGQFGWQAIFVASGTMASLSFLVCWAFLPRSHARSHSGPIDLLGGLLFVPGIFMFLIGLSYGKTWGWTNPQSTLPLLIGGLAVLVLWGWHELRTPNPLIDLRLCARKRVALANLANCGAALAFQQHLLFLLIQQPASTGAGFGIDARISGLLALPGPLLGLALTPFIASAASRLGSRPVLIAGGLVLLVVLLSQAAALLLDQWWWLAVTFTMLSVVSVCLYASVPNIIIADVPANRTSEATGLMQVQRSVAQAVSAQIVAMLLVTSTVMDPVSGTGPFPSYSAYLLSIGVITMFGLLTLVGALLLPRDAGRPTASAAA